MNNKEYKAIVKKAAKRYERLQELELKDSNGIKNRVNWFIAEYISKNQLKEFFREELLNNSETQIYLLRDHKKIPIMRVGNRVIKTNLIKRLDNLVNFLNEKEKEKLDFVKKLEMLNWKYKFVSDKETGVNKLLLKIIHDDTINESNLGKWKTKSYTIEQTTFNKRIDLTIEELKDLLGSI